MSPKETAGSGRKDEEIVVRGRPSHRQCFSFILAIQDRALSTETCPHCGAIVKKENLKGHVERVHSTRTAPQAKPQVFASAGPVFRSHRKRNIAILALVVLAIIGISIASSQFAAANTMRMHWHPQLSITSPSGALAVPADIGIVSSLWKDHSLDQYGIGMSPLHTHDTSGTIHVESNTARDFTLHEFLAIWGQPSDGSTIDGRTVVSLTVDGQAQTSPTQDVILKDGQKIVITTS